MASGGSVMASACLGVGFGLCGSHFLCLGRGYWNFMRA